MGTTESIYDVEFKDVNRNGKGIIKYSNLLIYEGEFKDGKKHGKGIFIFLSGYIYEGEFKDGKIHGKGKFKHLITGDVYEGNWINCKREGKFNGTYYGGKKEKQFYINGVLDEWYWDE